MPERPNKPDRLEREINEILDKIERFPDPEQRRSRARKRALRNAGSRIASWQQGLAHQFSRVTLSQLMLLAFLLILGSFFFRSMISFAWPWLLYAGAILFIVSFALMLFRGRRGGSVTSQQQYWRGRPVSYSSSSLSQRMRRWWSRHQNR